MASSSFTYDVFISHAGEDKITVALPLREMLLKHEIRGFVDEKDMRAGTHSTKAMIEAMKTATAAVVILSPEFVAREWPMKELLCFLRRTQKPLDDELPISTIIPLFYRLGIKELYGEPRFDRIDANGENLYAKSRFSERQARGEPEADEANIKEALQKLRVFMGIEDYSDASNENSSVMNKRREDLLNRLCEEIRETLRSKTDQFRCHYYKEKDKVLSGLVLDFEGCNDERKASPMEAEVLKAVLDTSKNTDVISLRGIGGVGKSSILQGLSNLDIVKQRYRDGVHLVSLGADATRNRLIKLLCKVVRDAGGSEKSDEMIKMEDCGDVFAAFESWFSGKHCLFMVDNVWETAEISLGLIEELVTLDLFASNRKLLFTSRRTDIASQPEMRFLLQTRQPLSSQCRGILVLHAGIEIDSSNAADRRAVREILSKCSGLPLFLKIAGKAVKAENDKLCNKGCFAYRHYAKKLHVRLQQFLNTPVGSYERLSTTLEISVQLVEDRKDGWGFGGHLTAAEMYRRLSTLLRQSHVPMSTLQNLWELGSDDEATMVAEEFERVGLATLEIEDDDSDDADKLSLHDSLHWYAVLETDKHGEKKLGHDVLVAGYGKQLETEDGCRAWWSRQLEVDGYVHRHICRHLLLAGLEEELLKLLLKPGWTIRSFMECGILDLERDYGLGVIAAKKTGEEEHGGQDRHHGRARANEIAIALQMVAEATRLSCGFKLRHPRELCFQLSGRLKSLAEENVLIKEYLCCLEAAATVLCGTWMRCISPSLTPPGGATTRIRYVGSAVECMVMSEDGSFVFCGCSDGVVVAVNWSSLEVVRQWCASFEGTQDMFSDGRFIFSPSKHGIVKVWEPQTEVLRRTLFNAEDLRCAKVTRDGRLVMAGWKDGTVGMQLFESGAELLKRFGVHDGRVLCIAALPDEEHFVSGGEDKKLRIWSANSGEQVGGAFVGHAGAVTCVSVIPRERHIVSGSRDGTLRIWDIQKRAQVASRRERASITCIAVCADGKRVVYALDKTVCVWNAQAGDQTCKLRTHTDRVTGVMIHPDGNSIISCSSDGTMRVSDLGRTRAEPEPEPELGLMRVHPSLMRPLHHVRGEISMALDEMFTRDQRHLVAQVGSNDIVVYDANLVKPVGRFLNKYAEGDMWGVVLPDDRWFLAVFETRVVGFGKLDSKRDQLWCEIEHEVCEDRMRPVSRVTHINIDSGTLVSLIVTEDAFCTPGELPSEVTSRLRRLQTDNHICIMLHEWPPSRAHVHVYHLDTGKAMDVRSSEFSFGGAPPQCWLKDVHPPTTYSETTASLVGQKKNIGCRGRDVWYVRGEERLLLGTLEACIRRLSVAEDGKKICVMLNNGDPVFMEMMP